MFEVDYCGDRQSTPACERQSERGRELASLDSSALRDRFYSWRGVSGTRYVCSIFPLAEENIVADFSGAVIVGVAHEGGSRRPVCVLSSREFTAHEGLLLRTDAHSLGVNEWHVRFGADRDTHRDLAISLLS